MKNIIRSVLFTCVLDVVFSLKFENNKKKGNVLHRLALQKNIVKCNFTNANIKVLDLEPGRAEEYIEGCPVANGSACTPHPVHNCPPNNYKRSNDISEETSDVYPSSIDDDSDDIPVIHKTIKQFTPSIQTRIEYADKKHIINSSLKRFGTKVMNRHTPEVETIASGVGDALFEEGVNEKQKSKKKHAVTDRFPKKNSQKKHSSLSTKITTDSKKKEISLLEVARIRGLKIKRKFTARNKERLRRSS